jgi:U3 small nucleolar RNA-associated protein 14
MNKEDQELVRYRAPADAQESMTPSEFGTNPKRKFTAADLLNSTLEPGLRNSHKVLADNDAKSFNKRAGTAKTLDAPLPKRQQDRLDRAAAYEQSKETLKRWIDTVKHNRRAEHLSFPIKDPNTVAAQGIQRLLPTSQSKPLTELEGTVQNLLQKSGLAAPNGGSEEDKLQAFEELRTNKMPLEEVQARRAELRKARELLFREEVRAKRIKKIKSKSYRKVHRKERERTAQQEKDALTAAGVDDSESEQERKDRRRAEERMGARHRESKWAKDVKDSGRAKWDEDARGGVTEMARRGEDLRRRIEGKQVAADEDGLISSASDAEDDMNDVEHKIHDRLQRLLPNADEADADAQGSKLASMDFMRKAEAAHKARNDADAESLRRDLAGEETPSDEETSEGPGRRLFGPSKSKPPPSQTPSREQKSEFEERQDSGDEDDRERHGAEDVEIIVDTSSARGRRIPVAKPSPRDRKKIADLQSSGDQSLVASENPWLTSSKKDSYGSKRQAKDTDRGAIISNTVALVDAPPVMMAKPRSALKGARDAEKTGQNAELSRAAAPAVMSDGDDQDDDTEKLPIVFRNQDLVRKAFAGDEVVADFDKEKQQTVGDEQDKIIDNTLPGWGTWTGAGISKKQEKRNKGKVLVKEPGIAKEKRQDAKLDRVIINEKRVKKNAKYLASNLPHPFETRQQYERSLRLPVGPEWTTKETFQSATKPRILMKQGVIAPMLKPII